MGSAISYLCFKDCLPSHSYPWISDAYVPSPSGYYLPVTFCPTYLLVITFLSHYLWSSPMGYLRSTLCLTGTKRTSDLYYETARAKLSISKHDSSSDLESSLILFFLSHSHPNLLTNLVGFLASKYKPNLTSLSTFFTCCHTSSFLLTTSWLTAKFPTLSLLTASPRQTSVSYPPFSLQAYSQASSQRILCVCRHLTEGFVVV